MEDLGNCLSALFFAQSITERLPKIHIEQFQELSSCGLWVLLKRSFEKRM